MMNRISQFIDIGIRRPKLALAFGFIILLFFSYGLNYFQSNFSARIWHEKDSIEIIKLNQFERQFGGDEILLLGIDYKKSVFNKELLSEIQNTTDQLWLLPNVLRVESLSNINHISFNGEDIDISPLVPEKITEITKIEKNSDSMDEIQNVLINKGKNFVLYSITINPSFGKSPDYSAFTNKLNELLEKKSNQKNSYYFLGSVAVANAFKDISMSDNKRLLPTMFLLIVLALGFYFRSLLGILIPIAVVIFTLIESFGFLAYMGYEFNSIIGALPGVLLGICLADAIHILTIFYQQIDLGDEPKEAIKASLQKNFIPTILTTVTTAISFLSISFTNLVPIHDLGMIAFFGTCMAWINTYLIIPSLIVLFFSKNIKKGTNNHFLRFDYSDFILKHNKKIILVFTTISFVALFLCFFNEANSDPLKYFTESTKIRKDFAHTEDEFGSIRSVNVVIDSQAEDGAKDPAFLKKVDLFVTKIEKLPYVTKVRSLLDTLKKMNQNLIDQKERSYAIPPSKSHVAEYLLLYSLGTSPGQGLENLVSQDHRFLNIQINWNVEDTNDSMRKISEIHDLAKEQELESHTGGTFSVYAGVNDKVVNSFFKSIILAILFVSVIIFLVFKDLFYSFLAMLPNFIPLLFVGAYTAITKTYIDVGSSIVFTICLGIAVDDTIHFMINYISNLKKTNSIQDALKRTFMTSGEAIFLTTLVLVAGFGSFVFADFLPNKKFGILSSMVLLIALLTDLIFLPALVSLVKKKK